MTNSDDWRLVGQERYLQGAILHHSVYKKSHEGLDHDHCEFCMVKFMEEERPEVLQEGYTTTDSYRWICATCFNDFRLRFGFNLEYRSDW